MGILRWSIFEEAMPDQEQRDSVRKIQLYRWLDLLALSAFAILICLIFHPSLISIGAEIATLLNTRHWVLQISAITLLTGIFWFILIRIGGFRFCDLNPVNIFRYPATWLSGVIAALIYFPLSESLFRSERFSTIQMDLWPLIAAILSGPGLAGIINFLFNKLEDSVVFDGPKPSSSEQIDLENLIEKDESLLQWLQLERPINKPSDDAFGFSVFARRAANILTASPLKTISIIGQYGCGKSSIINMIDYYLHSTEFSGGSPEIIRCQISGWGFQSGSAVVFPVFMDRELSCHP